MLAVARSCNLRTAAPARAHAADDAVDGSPRCRRATPESPASASAGGLRHGTSAVGSAPSPHCLDVKIEAPLIAVDLHEHVANAKRRASSCAATTSTPSGAAGRCPFVSHHRRPNGDIVEGLGTTEVRRPPANERRSGVRGGTASEHSFSPAVASGRVSLLSTRARFPGVRGAAGLQRRPGRVRDVTVARGRTAFHFDCVRWDACV